MTLVAPFQFIDVYAVLADGGLDRIDSLPDGLFQVGERGVELVSRNNIPFRRDLDAMNRVFVQDVHLAVEGVEAILDATKPLLDTIKPLRDTIKTLLDTVKAVLPTVEPRTDAMKLGLDIFKFPIDPIEPLFRHSPLRSKDDDDTSSDERTEEQMRCPGASLSRGANSCTNRAISLRGVSKGLQNPLRRSCVLATN